MGWATVLAPVLAAVIAIGGAYFVGRSTAPQHTATPPRHRATPSPIAKPIQFNIPEPARPDNPLPRVKCFAPVDGSGKLSVGYTLLIGNTVEGSNTYYFQPVRWPTADRWVSKNYFGIWSDGGHRFRLIAVVMPTALANYLVNANQIDRPPGSPYLAGQGIPPAPAVMAAKEFVRRAYYKSQREYHNSGC